ncbi:hypothetical protein C8J57DRAFT_1519928 [Mycena rebaudengoi]|nr:hypothetical protein C8J57DRAFT_1519928 [Mycena rebaudengoi]
MNVASLLQDSPSDRRSRDQPKPDPARYPKPPQQQQQPPPHQQGWHPAAYPAYREQQPQYPPPRTSNMYMAPPRTSSTPLYPSPVPASPTVPYSEPSSMYHAPRSPAMNSLGRRELAALPPHQPALPPHSSHPSLPWAGPQQRTFQNQFHTQFVPVREASPPRTDKKPPPPPLPAPKRPTAAWTDRDYADDALHVWSSQRAPSPPTERPLRVRKTLSLGTFVFPRTPFPYFFPPDAPATLEDGQLEDDHGVLETCASIIIPALHLPAARPPTPRIWGGGFASYTPVARRAPYVQDLRRRFYTDDSDLLACAVHAGCITWSKAAEARRTGRDVRMDVRVIRCLRGGGGASGEVIGRFVGGWGARCATAAIETDGSGEGDAEDDGRGLLSASWGAGHDGSAIEVLGVHVCEKNTARALGRPNRAQRLREYGERRVAVLPIAGVKRKWEDAWPQRQRLSTIPNRANPNALILEPIAEADEEEDADVREMGARTVVFGAVPVRAGFKYDPATLKGVLFPVPAVPSPSFVSAGTRGDDEDMEGGRERKRRRVSPSAEVDGKGEGQAEEAAMDVDPALGNDEEKEEVPTKKEEERRSIILETAGTGEGADKVEGETYLLSVTPGDGETWDVGVVEGEVEGTVVDATEAPSVSDVPPAAADAPTVEELPPPPVGEVETSTATVEKEKVKEEAPPPTASGTPGEDTKTKATVAEAVPAPKTKTVRRVRPLHSALGASAFEFGEGVVRVRTKGEEWTDLGRVVMWRWG